MAEIYRKVGRAITLWGAKEKSPIWRYQLFCIRGHFSYFRQLCKSKLLIIKKDRYWDECIPKEIPYTIAAEKFKAEEFQGSAEQTLSIKDSDKVNRWIDRYIDK